MNLYISGWSHKDHRFTVMLTAATILACFAVWVTGQEQPLLDLKSENDVFVLTRNNFHHVVSSHQIVLVLFHVPWDAKFKEILPQFEKVGKQLSTETPSVLLGKLDISLYPDIADELDVRGQDAQFIYYHLGKPYNFENFTKGEALVKILQHRSGIIWDPPRPHPELVAELSQHQFDRTLKSKDFAVVAFYRNNCPSCVRLLIEYESAVVNVTTSEKVQFYKCSLDEASDIAKQYELSETPILRTFRHGKMFDFSPREKLFAGILQHIKKLLLPPFKEFKTTEAAEGWARSYPNKATIFGYFDPNDKSPAFEAFKDTANIFREEHNFAWVHKNPDREKQIGQIEVYLPLRHVSPDDKKKVSFEGKPYMENLIDFIQKKTLPLVGQRTMKNKDTVYAKRPLLVAYITIDWSKNKEQDTQYHRDKVAHVVRGFPEFTFAISDRREFKHELLRMGLEKHTEEMLVGVIGKNGEYYPGPVVEIMNQKILTDLAENHRKNKLKPFHRTQSPPTSDDSDDYAVKTIVGATFRKLVLRHDKEVVLLLHRPQCPACKIAMNVVNDIAEEKVFPYTVFASMDTFANDPPARFNTSVYPMLYFVPYDKKQQLVPYSSRDFSREKVRAFLDSNASKIRIKTEL